MKIIRYIKDLPYKIYKILYWLPTLWKDHWWDSSFLLILMERKLQYDAKRYEKYGIACGCDDRAKQMRLAAAICKRLIDDDYKTPWDWEDREHSKLFMKHMEITTRKVGDLICHTSKGFNPEKKLVDASRFAHERRIYLRDYDLKYLCTFLNKHIL